MKKASLKHELEGVYVGSGNVFEDLNIPDAEAHDLKVQLAIRLNEIISDSGFSQSEIANRLGMKQPHVSKLTNYKLQGFSAERLMMLLVRLGYSLTIQISSQTQDEACLRVATVAEEVVPTVSEFDRHEKYAATWHHVSSGHSVASPPARNIDQDSEEYYGAPVGTSIERLTARFAHAHGVRPQ